jgi:hypothetical protein
MMEAWTERLTPAHPVQRNEILLGDDYERVRDERRRAGIELRNQRRVHVGPFITVLFENHDTVLHQLHEILRVEGTTSEAQIAQEIEVYNQMVAPSGCLTGTMLIEWRDLSTIREELRKLVGLDRSCFLDFPDGSRCAAVFDPYTQDAFELSAVQYLLFELSAEQRALLKEGQGPVRLSIEHDHYDHRVGLSPPLIEALGRDL